MNNEEILNKLFEVMMPRHREPNTIDSLLGKAGIKSQTYDEKSRIESMMIATRLVDATKETKGQIFYYLRLKDEAFVELKAAGSYKNFALQQAAESKHSDVVKRLEFEKLQDEVYDYPKTKARAIRSERVAIIAVIIAALTLAKDLLCK